MQECCQAVIDANGEYTRFQARMNKAALYRTPVSNIVLMKIPGCTTVVTADCGGAGFVCGPHDLVALGSSRLPQEKLCVKKKGWVS